MTQLSTTNWCKGTPVINSHLFHDFSAHAGRNSVSGFDACYGMVYFLAFAKIRTNTIDNSSTSTATVQITMMKIPVSQYNATSGIRLWLRIEATLPQFETPIAYTSILFWRLKDSWLCLFGLCRTTEVTDFFLAMRNYGKAYLTFSLKVLYSSVGGISITKYRQRGQCEIKINPNSLHNIIIGRKPLRKPFLK